LKIYEEWEEDVPSSIKTEPIWKFAGYRKALYLYDVTWDEVISLIVTELNYQRHRLPSR
jgi:hypothetical protein